MQSKDVDETAVEQSTEAEEETTNDHDDGVAKFDHKPAKGSDHCRTYMQDAIWQCGTSKLF